MAHAAPTAKASSKPGSMTKKTSGPKKPSTSPKAGAADRLAPAPTLMPYEGSLSDEEKALGDAIADGARHALAIAAARPTSASFAPEGFADIAQGFVEKLSPKERRASGDRARRLLREPAVMRRKNFGIFATKAATVHETTLQPVPPMVAAAARDKMVVRYRVATAANTNKTMTKIPRAYTKVGFQLNSVKCVEETDEVGADQIRLGGFAISPNGDLHKIKSFMVSSDFDKGETKKYYKPGSKHFDPNDPFRGRNLATLDLPAVDGGNYPVGFALSVIMAEEDSGGFSQMLEGLWSAVAKEIKKSIETVLAGLHGSLGQIIGQLVGYVLDQLIDFLVQLFDNPDDYVDRVDGFLGLASPNEEFFAGLTGRETFTPSHVWASKQQTWQFRGDGGHYRVKAHWRVW